MLCFGMLVAFLLDFALARALPDDLAWRFMVGKTVLRPAKCMTREPFACYLLEWWVGGWVGG